MTPIVAGIDYSMSCPALCIHEGSSFCFSNCNIYYLTSTKKFIGKFGKYIEGIQFPDYQTDEERFDNISDIFIQKINHHKCKNVGLEGYAMGARGRVFNIGENTGVLKHKMWKQGIAFDIFAPTLIKKTAADKGNADKTMMYESFLKYTSIDLKHLLQYTASTVGSPIGDIVDSFFICKHQHNQLS